MNPLDNINFHLFVESLVRAVETRDSYTAGHSDRVADLARDLAIHLGLPAWQAEYIHIAGHLHDIGKIGIPDGILLKTGRLSAGEFEVIKEHPGKGWNILKNIPALAEMSLLILHHHERFAGKGYPHGLSGRDIPHGARIIAIADTFDAITSARTYRPARDAGCALEIISRESGKQFDPEIVAGFLSLCGSITNFEQMPVSAG
jgi:HD-GYP domain-containing protein (c-di-GMP phosphodiesterase class II)